MNKARSRFSILVLILTVVVSARPQDSHSHSRKTTENPQGNPQWSELVRSTDRMHAAMALVGPSGNSDVDFVRLMLPHHQAAIDMARVQLVYGQDAQMRRLAQEIVTEQQSEIEIMQLWLKQHAPHK